MSTSIEGGVPQPEHKEGETRTHYQLLYDDGAFVYQVNEWTPEEVDHWETSGYRNQVGHFNQIGIYDSPEELEQAIEALRGPARFAVFEDRAAGTVYYSQEDRLTGNWRGSREGHANLMAEYETEDEAQRHVEEAKKRQEHHSA